MKFPPHRRGIAFIPVLVTLAVWSSPGCSENDSQDPSAGGGEGGGVAGSTSTATDYETGDIEIPITSATGDGDGDGDGDGGAGGAGGAGSLPNVIETLPKKFTEAENGGGYRIVGALEDVEVDTSGPCVNVLRVVVRDFLQKHIDFGEQKPTDWMPPGVVQGLIFPDLDPRTRKPEADPMATPTDIIEGFADWYVNTEKVNKPYVMEMWLEPQGDFFVFDTDAFFPLEAPWNEFSEDDLQLRDDELKNFLFTTEIHTAFEYQEDQVFNFRGDDDVWVFINNKLAVDIGGIHGAQVGDIDLTERADELGLEVGEVYSLDMFQAERNPHGSNFRIQTSLDFKECSVLEEDILR